MARRGCEPKWRVGAICRIGLALDQHQKQKGQEDRYRSPWVRHIRTKAWLRAICNWYDSDCERNRQRQNHLKQRRSGSPVPSRVVRVRELDERTQRPRETIIAENHLPARETKRLKRCLSRPWAQKAAAYAREVLVGEDEVCRKTEASATRAQCGTRLD